MSTGETWTVVIIFHGLKINIFPVTVVHAGLKPPLLHSQIDSTFFLETKTQHLLDLTPKLWLTVKPVVIATVVIPLASTTTHTTLESPIHLASSTLQRILRLKLAHQLMSAEICAGTLIRVLGFWGSMFRVLTLNPNSS